MDLSDRDLVRATLRGDSRAFEALLDRHGRVVWASVRRLAGDAEEARELYQDAVVRAYEKLNELQDPDRLRSWWVSIAMNLGRERLRKGARRAEREADPELLGQVPDGSEPVSAALEVDEQRAQLRAALAALPERQREVTELRLREGLSHHEIAAVLGITPEGSRANYYQAVQRLRERLNDA